MKIIIVLNPDNKNKTIVIMKNTENFSYATTKTTAHDISKKIEKICIQYLDLFPQHFTRIQT